ncbi:hypothetical protein FISHEDRAFT_59725 [Fistulina hepatica ATCC 64428]|uniref:Uncharacterized protein n=1 Tax=Fistulina hepatica ATCC 64428 TaxID=1128425 RepID=A0A0D7A9J6_9AGAR|nr:hypothetical protein FISHEDRAFT_59725 [Fistulina hepatica ATCC 64428]
MVRMPPIDGRYGNMPFAHPLGAACDGTPLDPRADKLRALVTQKWRIKSYLLVGGIPMSFIVDVVGKLVRSCICCIVERRRSCEIFENTGNYYGHTRSEHAAFWRLRQSTRFLGRSTHASNGSTQADDENRPRTGDHPVIPVNDDTYAPSHRVDRRAEVPQDPEGNTFADES